MMSAIKELDTQRFGIAVIVPVFGLYFTAVSLAWIEVILPSAPTVSLNVDAQPIRRPVIRLIMIRRFINTSLLNHLSSKVHSNVSLDIGEARVA
jgi:hypothetical protein